MTTRNELLASLGLKDVNWDPPEPIRGWRAAGAQAFVGDIAAENLPPLSPAFRLKATRAGNVYGPFGDKLVFEASDDCRVVSGQVSPFGDDARAHLVDRRPAAPIVWQVGVTLVLLETINGRPVISVGTVAAAAAEGGKVVGVEAVAPSVPQGRLWSLAPGSAALAVEVGRWFDAAADPWLEANARAWVTASPVETLRAAGMWWRFDVSRAPTPGVDGAIAWVEAQSRRLAAISEEHRDAAARAAMREAAVWSEMADRLTRPRPDFGLVTLLIARDDLECLLVTLEVVGEHDLVAELRRQLEAPLRLAVTQRLRRKVEQRAIATSTRLLWAGLADPDCIWGALAMAWRRELRRE
jgi:hypothetical protein